MRINLIAPALTIALVPAMAAAQTQPRANNDAWAGTIGLATVAMPTYMGSNQYKVVAVPLISLEFKERAFLGAASNGIGAGAGVYLVRRSNLMVTTEVTGSPERIERHGNGLAGMGRRSGATFSQSDVSYTSGSITAGASVALGLGNDEGSTASLSLSSKHVYGKRWIVGASTGATFANSANMAYDFGITPEQASKRQTLIQSGDSRLDWRDAGSYDPGRGLKQATASMSLGYQLREKVTTMAFINGTRLGREAADSPLARNRNAIVGGIGMAYGF